MTKAEKITKYLKGIFEMYSLNYTEYFGHFDEEDGFFEIPLGRGSKVNMDMIAIASQALGISTADILAMDEKAAGKWYRKYPYFFHLTGFNHAYKCTFYAKEADALFLMDAIFGSNVPKPSKYDFQDIEKRLGKALTEIDAELLGVDDPHTPIEQLEITTANFCRYDGITEMIESFCKMIERAKELFFKAWNEDLTEEEIHEYNIIVSAARIHDKNYGISNLLYYNNLKNCVDVYKEEGFPNFFDYVTLDRKKACRPWRCAEFSANKELVQAYVNCYPTAKQEMREFAMEALNFKCYFTWEGTGEFSQSLKETARLEAMAQELQEASGTGEPIQRNVHIIFVPKTEAELDGAKADAEALMQLCRAVSLGGVTLPRYAPRDLKRMFPRVGKIKSHNYAQWYENHLNGGGTNG